MGPVPNLLLIWFVTLFLVAIFGGGGGDDDEQFGWLMLFLLVPAMCVYCCWKMLTDKDGLERDTGSLENDLAVRHKCYLCKYYIKTEHWQSGEHRIKCAKKLEKKLDELSSPYPSVVCPKCGKSLKLLKQTEATFFCDDTDCLNPALVGDPDCDQFFCYLCDFKMCWVCVIRKANNVASNVSILINDTVADELSDLTTPESGRLQTIGNPGHVRAGIPTYSTLPPETNGNPELIPTRIEAIGNPGSQMAGYPTNTTLPPETYGNPELIPIRMETIGNPGCDPNPAFPPETHDNPDQICDANRQSDMTRVPTIPGLITAPFVSSPDNHELILSHSEMPSGNPDPKAGVLPRRNPQESLPPLPPPLYEDAMTQF